MTNGIMKREKVVKKKGDGSIYMKIKSILKNNPNNMYTRTALRGLLNVTFNLSARSSKHELDSAYWNVATALEYLEDDGFIGKTQKGREIYYFWGD